MCVCLQKEARKSLEGVEAVSTDLTSVFEGFKVSRDAPERKRERESNPVLKTESELVWR